MALLNFSTSGQAEMDDFTVIPPGNYNVQAVKSDIKDTKAGTGKRLNIQFKVLDGDYAGRILFAGLNIVNPNPTAVEISMKELTSICKACGKDGIDDSAELHKIPLTVSVKIKPAEGTYAEQNQITKYMKYGEDGTKLPTATAEATATGTETVAKAENGGGEAKPSTASDDMPWE